MYYNVIETEINHNDDTKVDDYTCRSTVIQIKY